MTPQAVRPRKVWQHDVSLLSVDQLKELLHGAGWVIVDIVEDYGEDLLARIFDNGNPTGNDFYIQLKGTKNIGQYALRSGGHSYGIETKHLRQWQAYPIPVVFILWDTERRSGYWQLLQPFIAERLEANPQWLDNSEAVRSVRLQPINILEPNSLFGLRDAITTEFDNLRVAKQSIAATQEIRLELLRRTLENEVSREPSARAIKGSSQIHPSVKQQLLIAQYKATTLSDPEDAKAWLQLASLYYELNDLDKALTAINEAWQLNSQDPHIINARASIFCEYAVANNGGPASMVREAIDLFSAIRKGTSLPAAIDYNIGNCYAALAEHQTAIQYFEKALVGNPPPPLAGQIWTNRGRSFSQLRDLVEAVRSYQQAINIDPARWQAYSSWAYAELLQEHYQSSRALFLKCLEIRPELERMGDPQLYSLAYSLWKLNDLEGALERVSQLLSFRPSHSNALLLKSHILSQLWRANRQYVAEALVFFKSRLIDDSGDMVARGELYLILNSANYKDEARALIQETVSLSNAPVQSLYHYAMLLEDDGDIAKAIGYLELAFQKSKKHHIVHNLARLKMKSGSFRSAIKLYKMALNGVSDPVGIFRGIADCYHFLGQHKQSAKFEVMALLRTPRSDLLWSNLQYSLMQLGQEDLFTVFNQFLRRLRNREDVTDVQLHAAVDELLSRLAVTFGRRFVNEIVRTHS
jgi:tetratricopeptide (TPR) repeat protein